MLDGGGNRRRERGSFGAIPNGTLLHSCERAMSSSHRPMTGEDLLINESLQCPLSPHLSVRHSVKLRLLVLCRTKAIHKLGTVKKNYPALCAGIRAPTFNLLPAPLILIAFEMFVFPLLSISANMNFLKAIKNPLMPL